MHSISSPETIEIPAAARGEDSLTGDVYHFQTIGVPTQVSCKGLFKNANFKFSFNFFTKKQNKCDSDCALVILDQQP